MAKPFTRPGRAARLLLPVVICLWLASPPAGAAVVDPQLATAIGGGAGPWQVIVTFHDRSAAATARTS